MTDLLMDLRIACRHLAARPVLTLAAAACIAIGIGATTTIFSLTDGVLLRPLPGVVDPATLLEVGRDMDGGVDTLSYPEAAGMRESLQSLDLAVWSLLPGSIADTGEAQALLAMQVTDNYMDVLGTTPALGRGFTAAEGAPGSGAAVVVISDAYWRRQFAADPAILGRDVRFNGVPATIIGVAPAGFAGTWSIVQVDAWVPMGMRARGLMSEEDLGRWRSHSFFGVGRLRDGHDAESARNEVKLSLERLTGDNADHTRVETAVAKPMASIPSVILPGVRLFLGVLMGAVGLVLLVACVNVAGMLLAAATARRREIAVRLALGATRGRLARQLLAETLVLFGLGGAGGVLIAVIASRLLLAFDPPVPPPFDLQLRMALDLRVLGFAALTTLATGIAFGLAPAFRAARPDLVPALKDEPVRMGRLRGRTLLVAGQAAMTVLLVVVSALFLRALDRAADVALGFDPTAVYTHGVDMDLAGLEREAAVPLLREMRQRIGALPGVEAVGMARMLPLGLPESMGFGGVNVAGFAPPSGAAGFAAEANVVTPGYFDTLRLPVVAGREFREDDEPAMAQAVINARMATHFWGSPAAAVGQTFDLDDEPFMVLGVAGDAKYSTLLEDTPFFIYLAIDRRYVPAMNVMVRVAGDPAVTLAAVRATVRDVAPDLPVLDVMALRDYVEVTYLPQRAAASVAGVLGLVALLLAATGMYGVTSQVAASRLHEVGVRIAVGADRRDVMSLLMRRGMLAPIVGLVVGVGMAVAVSGLLESLLFGVSGLDPIAFALGVVALTGVAFMANLGPARWAASVDPVRVLRNE